MGNVVQESRAFRKSLLVFIAVVSLNIEVFKQEIKICYIACSTTVTTDKRVDKEPTERKPFLITQNQAHHSKHHRNWLKEENLFHKTILNGYAFFVVCCITNYVSRVLIGSNSHSKWCNLQAILCKYTVNLEHLHIA